MIEGTKGVITTFNTITGEVYVAQDVFLSNYEINVDNSNLTSGYVDKYVDNLLMT